MDQRILIIDGHPVYINKLAGFLGSLTYRNVTLADTGQEGVSKAASLKPHLVIMSGMLPDMDAYEVCKRIRQENESTKIVVQVGLFTEEEDMQKFQECGADAVLDRKEKDFTPLQEAIMILAHRGSSSQATFNHPVPSSLHRKTNPKD